MRNLRDSLGQVLLPVDNNVSSSVDNDVENINAIPSNTTIPVFVSIVSPYNKIYNESTTTNDKLSRDCERTVDRNPVEFNLNAQDSMLTNVCGKKNVKGVKLVGMDGGTLRRPSLQVRHCLYITSLA